jgi:saccharopine dehydrogenase-like NADP-dependent oxidoreductase
MSKHILIFGAGRSATVLIDYLKKLLVPGDWRLTVADSNRLLAEAKTANAPYTSAIQIDIKNSEERRRLISEADVVISMLPPALHFPVAEDCCMYKKHLLTASYISEEIKQLSKKIADANILFLCEMGLDPGIDHMSAMQIIDRLHASGAEIVSFTSHCGGLVAPESDDNPWHYKISWNSANVVKAGATGAVFKEDHQEKYIPYQQLFQHCSVTNVPGFGHYAWYPNRDSLHYIPLYGLEKTRSFLRTTLRHPDFCSGWHCIVQAGLTSEEPIESMKDLTFKKWSQAILPFITKENKEQFGWLGLFDENLVPQELTCSAAILQHLLEKKLMLREHDKDMIIMMHEFTYRLNSRLTELKSLLVVKGEDNLHTAMAKTVGLPLGIATKLLLEDKIQLRGLHIPVSKEIYEPVLDELSKLGIFFIEESKALD